MAYDLNLIREQIRKRPAARKYMFEKDFFEYCRYYFQDNFLVDPAPRQLKLCEDLRAGKNIIIVGHRESAKTTYVRWYIDYVISRQLAPFILWGGYDKDLASENVYYIGQDLQENQRIIEDYGLLYRDENVSKQQAKKKRRMDAFIAENEVYLKATSLLKSTRGLLHKFKGVNVRPKIAVLDDVDVLKSVGSTLTIDKNYTFLKNEFLGGLDASAQKIILGNVIYEDGLIPRLVNDYSSSFVYYRIPTITQEYGATIIRNEPVDNIGETNRSRFVKTKVEANKLNQEFKEKHKSKSKPYVSLEQLKADLGPSSYKSNHLLIPMTKGESIVKRSRIKYIKEHWPFDISNKRVIGIDPAFSEKTNSDPIGIVVTAQRNLGQSMNFKVLEALRLQGTEKDVENIVTVVSNLYEDYDAGLIVIESNNGGEIIGRALKKAGLAVLIISSTKDKVTRLREKETLFTQGLIEFDSEKTKDLIDELLTFPSGKHDDLVDAFGFSMNTADSFADTNKNFEEKKRESLDKHGGYKGVRGAMSGRF